MAPRPGAEFARKLWGGKPLFLAFRWRHRLTRT